MTAIAAGSDANANPVLYIIETTDSQVYSMPFNATGDSTGNFTLTTAGTVRTIVLA